MIADILLKRSPNFFLGYFWKHRYWNKNWSGYFLGNFWYNWATFYSCIWSHRPPTITVHLIELFSVWPWWKVSRLWRSADSKYDVAKIFNLVRRRLICIFYTFLKKWADPGLFFVYFHYFLDTISIIQIEKSIDGVLGIRTRGCRMVGADETTELWRPPRIFYISIFDLSL